MLNNIRGMNIFDYFVYQISKIDKNDIWPDGTVYLVMNLYFTFLFSTIVNLLELLNISVLDFIKSLYTSNNYMFIIIIFGLNGCLTYLFFFNRNRFKRAQSYFSKISKSEKSKNNWKLFVLVLLTPAVLSLL